MSVLLTIRCTRWPHNEQKMKCFHTPARQEGSLINEKIAILSIKAWNLHTFAQYNEIQWWNSFWQFVKALPKQGVPRIRPVNI